MAGIKKTAVAPQDDEEQQEGTPGATDSPAEDQAEGGDQSQPQGDQGQGDQGPPQDDSGDPQPNVSPEEQAQYDEFVTNGMHLIYQKQGDTVQVAPAVLAQLKGDWKGVEGSLGQVPQEEKPLDPKSPADCLAVATVALVLSLEASATGAGKQLDPAVTFHGGAELLEQLADIDSAAGIHDFSDDEMTGAAHRTALLYGVSTKTMNKQEALSEFDHFLKTQGDSLGQSLGAEAQGGDQSAQQQPPGGIGAAAQQQQPN
jgi:hypothetical protein